MPWSDRRARSLLTIPVKALSQVGGGASPHRASASSSLGTARPCSAARYAKVSRLCRPGNWASATGAPSLTRATRPKRNTLHASRLDIVCPDLARLPTAFLARAEESVDDDRGRGAGDEGRDERMPARHTLSGEPLPYSF